MAIQPYAPFATRVPAVQKAIAEANRETGGRTIYAPTFSGGGRSIAEQTRIAKDCAVKIGLAAPMLIGIPAFVELQVDFDVPIVAHPAFAGAGRIAPSVLLGKLFRLFGADATIFPNHGGRFSYSPETCLAIATAPPQPWHPLRPPPPAPSRALT